MSNADQNPDEVKAKKNVKALCETKCEDCGFKHGYLAVARIEYGRHPNMKVISIPLEHCTDIKIIILKQNPKVKP